MAYLKLGIGDLDGALAAAEELCYCEGDLGHGDLIGGHVSRLSQKLPR